MIWGYHYFWKHPYFSIALARMIAGYRKIESFVKEHHLEIQILAQKPILLSGSVTGFHSPYIEDTRIKKRWISSIAQLKTPFTLGFCTTSNSPRQIFPAHLDGHWVSLMKFGCEDWLGTSLDQYCWWTIRVKPWTRPSKSWSSAVATASLCGAMTAAREDDKGPRAFSRGNQTLICLRSTYNWKIFQEKFINLAILLVTFLGWWKRDLFKGCWWPPNRVYKGHGLNHLEGLYLPKINISMVENLCSKRHVLQANASRWKPSKRVWSLEKRQDLFDENW